LQTNVLLALQEYSVIQHKDFGKIYAYEINGFDSNNQMDDANIPSLTSLSYLSDIGLITHDFDAISYKQICNNSRKFALSKSNPFFFKGKVAEGIGGPHVGLDYIWPLSIIMRGLTSTDDKEIKKCLDMLQQNPCRHRLHARILP
jgi:meiotically up-regulated gene 157 (Mug157) protein